MKKIVLLSFVLATCLFAKYSANCSTNDGKSFTISVNNKIMTIDNKYTATYSNKTWDGWFEYMNKGYIYSTGPFEAGRFPIKVKNIWGLNTQGTCYFK